MACWEHMIQSGEVSRRPVGDSPVIDRVTGYKVAKEGAVACNPLQLPGILFLAIPFWTLKLDCLSNTLLASR